MEDFTKSFKMERSIPSFLFFFILIKFSIDFTKSFKMERSIPFLFFFFLFSLNRFYIDRRIFLIDGRFHEIFQDGMIDSIPPFFFFFFWFSLNRFYIDLFDSILHIFDRWKISWNLSKWNNLFHPFFFFFYPH